MLLWEYTEHITVRLEIPSNGIFPGCTVVCQWLVAPLFSFPSIQSYAKGLSQYYDSIITILEDYADFRNHTSLLSLSRRNLCRALD